MSLKINEDPVSTPASEWASQTTNAVGSSVDKHSSGPTTAGGGEGSTATTPGVDLPGGFPRSKGQDDAAAAQLPDVSQHVERAKEYVNSADLAQHVETVKQYLPAREDVQARVVSVAQTVGQYLPESVVNAVGGLFRTCNP